MEDLNIQEMWKKVLEILKGRISETSYNMWVKPLEPYSFDGGCFTVLTGSNLAVSFLDRDKKEILEASAQVIGREVLFKAVYDEDLKKRIDAEQKKAKKEEDKEYLKNFEKRLKPTKYDGLMQMQSECGLNLKYKFENFVAGSCNKFAYAAALAAAKEPGKKYNPLFIYGSSGLGKTHLLQAVGAYILFHKQKKVKYITAEEFTNDLVNTIFTGGDKAEKQKKFNSFRDRYRNIDVLLIDDIQFLEGKERTIEELFNTFNTLHSSGKQIVIASDRSPDELEKLKNIDKRLTTRFQQGLTADVQVPDVETRMAILQKLAEDNNIKFPQEVTAFLASVYNKNIRELEGAFNRVCAYASINDVPINAENVKKIIGYKENVKMVTPEGVIDAVSRYYNISVSDIKGQSREAAAAKARNISAYLMREMTDESFSAIGGYLNRKYTTIMHSCDKIKKDMTYDRRIAQEVQEISDKINS